MIAGSTAADRGAGGSAGTFCGVAGEVDGCPAWRLMSAGKRSHSDRPGAIVILPGAPPGPARASPDRAVVPHPPPARQAADPQRDVPLRTCRDGGKSETTRVRGYDRLPRSCGGMCLFEETRILTARGRRSPRIRNRGGDRHADAVPEGWNRADPSVLDAGTPAAETVIGAW